MPERTFSNSIDDLHIGDLGDAQLDALALSFKLYGHKLRLTTSGAQTSDGKVGSWHVSLNGGKQTQLPWCPIADAVAHAKQWAHEVLGIPMAETVRLSASEIAADAE